MLIWLDVAWVFTIVVLPLPTEITAVYKASELTTTIYVGTCLVSMLLLTVMSVYLYRHPELQKKGKRNSTVHIWGAGSTAVAFLLAVLLELILPPLHYYALLVLVLAIPLDLVVRPRIRRREAQAIQL